MKLRDLLNGCSVATVRGSPEIEIQAVTEDSRVVRPGALFIARRGGRADGRAFIADAVARGAVAILTEIGCDPETGGAALLHAADPAAAGAVLAEWFHGCPSARLALIGITGTNGKTTTSYLIKHLLECAGRRCGLMGTVIVDDGRAKVAASLTTPGPVEISGTLARMVNHGCTHAVMEVSSHALVQKRTAGLRFAAGVFTNLSGDHLDYHESMSRYADAKAILFDTLAASATAVVNADDPAAPRITRDCKARMVRCSLESNDADAFAEIESMTASATRARFNGPWGACEVDLPLIGRHNVANALHAAATAAVLGVSGETIGIALQTCAAPPGRLEPVSSPEDAINVFVDYAHTDAALENVLRAVRPTMLENASLWIVFGAGGDRDRTKRPRMAAAACALADRVVITSDNPRTEDPRRIIADIREGVPAARHREVLIEIDRAAAIERAIRAAAPGDVMIIAGKGHENYQIIGTERRPFDDRTIARRALDARRRSLVMT